MAATRTLHFTALNNEPCEILYGDGPNKHASKLCLKYILIC
jgi:hypothetical protein